MTEMTEQPIKRSGAKLFAKIGEGPIRDMALWENYLVVISGEKAYLVVPDGKIEEIRLGQV